MWLRKQHPGIDWRTLRRRYLTGEPGWRPAEEGITLFVPQRVKVTRYRWRGLQHPDTMGENRDGMSRAVPRESVERWMR